MLSKISSMLDAIADSLEAKSLVKEAYEIDKIADEIEASVSQFFHPSEYKHFTDILKDIIAVLNSKKPKILADIEKTIDNKLSNKNYTVKENDTLGNSSNPSIYIDWTDIPPIITKEEFNNILNKYSISIEEEEKKYGHSGLTLGTVFFNNFPGAPFYKVSTSISDIFDEIKEKYMKKGYKYFAMWYDPEWMEKNNHKSFPISAKLWY